MQAEQEIIQSGCISLQSFMQMLMLTSYLKRNWGLSIFELDEDINHILTEVSWVFKKALSHGKHANTLSISSDILVLKKLFTLFRVDICLCAPKDGICLVIRALKKVSARLFQIRSWNNSTALQQCWNSGLPKITGPLCLAKHDIQHMTHTWSQWMDGYITESSECSLASPRK